MKGKKSKSPKQSGKPQDSFGARYIAVMLFLTFFIFTFIGVGSVIVVSFAGIFLCTVGLMQSSVKADLWILIPLILYNLISLLSGYRVYGNTVDGLSSTQSIFPVIYLLTAYLGDSERALLKKLCAVWVGVMALIGIGQFTVAAFDGNALRLSGFMGNPNTLGAILVYGWFALQSCLLEQENPVWERLLHGLEFAALAALGLTLSMGSFGALGIGIIAMHIYGKKSFPELLRRAAETAFAIGCGILLYVAGNVANWSWLCVVLCVYIFAAAAYRGDFKRYLTDRKWVSILICLAGICGAGVLIILRPNAAATFTERLAMIKNGLGYLGKEPLLGVGPYQWRGLNLRDADTYFNTWHIHNMFIHVGVEFGLAAMAMLVITAIRHACKREDAAQRGEFFAALTHSLMDVSFFYVSTVPFLLMTAGKDESRTVALSGTAVKCFFGAFAVLFIWNLTRCLL